MKRLDCCVQGQQALGFCFVVFFILSFTVGGGLHPCHRTVLRAAQETQIVFVMKMILLVWI